MHLVLLRGAAVRAIAHADDIVDVATHADEAIAFT